jgi:hypothetical protein
MYAYILQIQLNLNFPCILHKRLKEWRIRRKRVLLSTTADKVKGIIFRENLMGDHKPAYDEQITNLIFLLYLTKRVLSAYVENTLNSKKSLKN